jgi:dihydroorotase
MSTPYASTTAGSSQARLVSAPARPADVLFCGPHVLDPRTGIDARHDVLVRDGVIAEIAAPGTIVAPDGDAVEIVDGEGRHLFPAFDDPHVHLRTPGQEHKEDLETGTRAAAAGGYCAIVAMPNTSPGVDAAPILGALLDAAARRPRCRKARGASAAPRPPASRRR